MDLLSGNNEPESESSESLGSAVDALQKRLQVTLRKHTHAIYRDFFSAFEIEKFHLKIINIFLTLAQNIDCGYTLEPPWRGSSNDYP